MYGITRGLIVLVSVVVTGLLIWAAGGLETATAGGYWTAEALIVVAGLALALGQVVGRWPRAGRPRFSPAVFVLAFLPALLVSAWLAAAAAPHHGWLERHARSWSADLGVLGGVDRLAPYVALGAVVVGLMLGFSFDGPARRLRDSLAPASVGDAPDGPEVATESELAPAEEETAAVA